MGTATATTTEDAQNGPPAISAEDMDFNTIGTDETATTALDYRIDRSLGRTAIAVPGTDLAPTDTEGWKINGQQVSQRISTNIRRESPSVTKTEPQSSEAFARRMAARLTKASRMPNIIPRE